MKRVYLYLASRGGRQKFTLGTFSDLKVMGIEPSPGLRLHFYTDDADDAGNRDNLVFEGMVGCDEATGKWYADVDPESICHESDLKPNTE